MIKKLTDEINTLIIRTNPENNEFNRDWLNETMSNEEYNKLLALYKKTTNKQVKKTTKRKIKHRSP